MILCYEADYDGFWLHLLLEGQGVRSHVIDPASVQVDRRARRAKTDHIDAERLLRSLIAYLRGEPNGVCRAYQVWPKKMTVGYAASAIG